MIIQIHSRYTYNSEFLTHLQIIHLLRRGPAASSIFANGTKRRQLNAAKRFYYKKILTLVFIQKQIRFFI